ncbi:hypothetical protein [Martelella mangrovi]|uniref:Uncharacterized protein (DUF1697 family) n=1 Tax=Martelella mangrovi TaxID=1397477 RepID=A0ABV2IFN4_9HYPH
MTVFTGLLRAVNVGGTGKLAGLSAGTARNLNTLHKLEAMAKAVVAG